MVAYKQQKKSVTRGRWCQSGEKVIAENLDILVIENNVKETQLFFVEKLYFLKFFTRDNRRLFQSRKIIIIRYKTGNKKRKKIMVVETGVFHPKKEKELVISYYFKMLAFFGKTEYIYRVKRPLLTKLSSLRTLNTN